MQKEIVLIFGFLLAMNLIQCLDSANAPGKSDTGNLGNKSMLGEADRIWDNMKSTTYDHKTNVDEADGIYDFDCSGFIDYVLSKVRPGARAAIPHQGHIRPLADDFYHYFMNLSDKPNNAGWSRIERPIDLLPGDIIAWLQSPLSRDHQDTGHIMMVESMPSVNPMRTEEVLIPVIDSTVSPHANDTRPEGSTGLGMGTIGINVNGTGNPLGFYWHNGESTKMEPTKIAFGRIR